MRGFLWILFLAGLSAIGAGALDYMSLRPALFDTPAIVIMPQLIQATLKGGLGALVTTISAVGLALLAQGDDQTAALRALPTTARRSDPAPPMPSRAPRPEMIPAGMRACPACKYLNATDARSCINCNVPMAPR